MNAKSVTATLIKLALTLAILYFLYRQVAQQWPAIKAHDWHIHWGWLTLSVAAGLLTFFILSTIWQRIMIGLGHRLSLGKAFRIFYLSNLGKYIPGRVWQWFGILYLTNKEGIPPERAGVSFVLVELFALPASFLVFVLCAQLEPRVLVDQVAILGSKSAYFMTAGMLAVSAAVVWWPNKILSIGNAILRKLKRPQVDLTLDKKVALKIFLSYCLAWFCFGGAFWLFVRALSSEVGFSLIAAVGVFNAAYQIGYLAIFAPGGIGPRELVMGVMLTPFFGPIAPAVAVAARLWSLIIEAIAALLALRIRK